MLIDKIIANDTNKVIQIVDYLKDQKNNDYLILYPIEEILINYWTKNYDNVLRITLSNDSTKYKIRPSYDSLFQVIYHISRKDRLIAHKQIDNSNLNNRDKDFLKLNFDYLIKDSEISCGICKSIFGISDYYINQDSLNSNSGNYFKKYPASPYEKFIKDNIRIKYIYTGKGIGGEMSLGIGTFTNSQKNKFNGFGVLGFGFEIYYKGIGLFGKLHNGTGDLNDSIKISNVIWQNKSITDIYMFDCVIGYEIIKNKYFRFVPFSGLSTITIAPTSKEIEKNTDYEKIELGYPLTYSLGFNLDIYLGKQNFTSWRPDDASMFIRLRYSYNIPQSNQKFNWGTGQYNMFSIGIGMIAKSMKRDD